MANGSGIASVGRSRTTGCHPSRRHCTPMEWDKNDAICNYCGLLIKSGSITQFKFYIKFK